MLQVFSSDSWEPWLPPQRASKRSPKVAFSAICQRSKSAAVLFFFLNKKREHSLQPWQFKVIPLICREGAQLYSESITETPVPSTLLLQNGTFSGAQCLAAALHPIHIPCLLAAFKERKRDFLNFIISNRRTGMSQTNQNWPCWIHLRGDLWVTGTFLIVSVRR